jgi:beta-phosphoglucomutase
LPPGTEADDVIRAMIFDLDGTLVQTEKLKAVSYARAAAELKPEVKVADIVRAYQEVVGLSRENVAVFLTKRFGLEGPERRRMSEFGVSEPWQVLVSIRMKFYARMTADASLIRRNRWPHTIALLKEARRSACKTGLASMSYRDEVRRILGILHLARAFDAVAARDDVRKGKPDPEIYLLISNELGVPPVDCLVIEDSANGVRSALAAGMACVAVATAFTIEGLREAKVLDARWIVEDHARVSQVVRERLAASRG